MHEDILVLIVPNVNNSFFGEIIKGVNQIARRHDYTVFICDTDEKVKNETRVLETILQKKARGVIIAPISERAGKNAGLLKSIRQVGTQVVLVDRDVKNAGFDGVFVDNYKGSFDGVEALIKAGHRDIGIIAGPETSRPGRERLKGYLEALWMYGISVNEDLVQYGDFKWESGYRLTHKMMGKRPRPSAIFVSNNRMGIGCIKALAEMKLSVPEDVSLLLFDNTEAVKAYSYSISVINRSAMQMGIEAAKILFEKIRHSDERKEQTPKRVILLPKLELQGLEVASSLQ